MGIERSSVMVRRGALPQDTCWAVTEEVLFQAEFAGITPGEARALVWVLVQCGDCLQVAITPDLLDGYAPGRRDLRRLARKGVIRLHELKKGSFEIQLVRKLGG